MRPGEPGRNPNGGSKKATLRAQLKRILRESGDDQEFVRSVIDIAIGRKKPNGGNQFDYVKEVFDRVDGPVDKKVNVTLQPSKSLDDMGDAEFYQYKAMIEQQLAIEGPREE